MTVVSINFTKATKLADDLQLISQQGLSYAEPRLKNQFHTVAKALLKLIAADLGYSPSAYELRSNKGGIAVGGEITLHTDDLYIQIYAGSFGGKAEILYRYCQGRRDYSGGSNNFMAIAELAEDYETAITRFSSIRKTIVS
jgi:hypothetical protein